MPRLMLVDDEPRNLALLEAYLAPLGHVLTKAGGGEEALEVFEREGADLILLDVLMPDLDGIDVLTHVRAHERGQHVPVVLVTGQTEREARLRGFEAGADEFLEKPVDRALLLARVGTLLRLKEAGDELVRRNETLERLQREQREMTGFIVHDLKNPLAVVHINLEWLKQEAGAGGGPLAEALDDALDASKRLQKMIDDLLAVARIEQVDVPPERAPIALDELLREVARGHTREAQGSRVAISVEAEAGLRVEGDRAILVRVVENLVGNALRYTPKEGKIGLVARGGSELVEVAVSNTGRPIPEQQRSRIFEKFRRGEGEARSPGHSGLGLYFCLRAMEAHGGSISLAQTETWPTSFVLRFPAGAC
jgi:two-component system sensor histidine kinase/response regulator